MKIKILFVLMLLVASLSAQTTKKAIVRSVHDADSYGVRYLDRPDTTIYIRLQNVDAPEVIFYVTKDQPYARKAAEIVRNLIKGDTVDIQYSYTDSFNRPVCKVWKDSINLTEFVIANGCGWYLIDSATTFEEEAKFKQLQAEAKKNKVGLWGEPGRKYRPSTWRKNYSRR